MRREWDWDCLGAAIPLEKQRGMGLVPAVLYTLLHCILTPIQTAAFLSFLLHFARNNPCCFESLEQQARIFPLLPMDMALHLTLPLGHGLGASIQAPLFALRAVTPWGVKEPFFAGDRQLLRGSTRNRSPGSVRFPVGSGCPLER